MKKIEFCEATKGIPNTIFEKYFLINAKTNLFSGVWVLLIIISSKVCCFSVHKITGYNVYECRIHLDTNMA